MIRGAKKQMIVLHTGDSPYFDAAYFILKNKQGKEKTATGDMLAEANRILSENQPVPLARREKFVSLRPFFIGVLAGACVSALVLVLIFLL